MVGIIVKFPVPAYSTLGKTCRHNTDMVGREGGGWENQQNTGRGILQASPLI